MRRHRTTDRIEEYKGCHLPEWKWRAESIDGGGRAERPSSMLHAVWGSKESAQHQDLVFKGDSSLAVDMPCKGSFNHIQFSLARTSKAVWERRECNRLYTDSGNTDGLHAYNTFLVPVQDIAWRYQS